MFYEIKNRRNQAFFRVNRIYPNLIKSSASAVLNRHQCRQSAGEHNKLKTTRLIWNKNIVKIAIRYSRDREERWLLCSPFIN